MFVIGRAELMYKLGAKIDYPVLRNGRSFVEVELWTQIEGKTCLADLDYQVDIGRPRMPVTVPPRSVED